MPVTKQELSKYYLKADEKVEAQRGPGTSLWPTSWEIYQILTQVVCWSPQIEWIYSMCVLEGASFVAQTVKNLSAMQETRV